MGRRRKASTSTVETIDKTSFPWTKETSILYPFSETLDDNSWPIFVLTDAVVYQKDGRTFGNPLFVDKVGPLRVVGKLEITEDDPENTLEARRNRNLKSANMEITASTRYAIGQDPNSGAMLWVSGLAGWYEIRPAPEFETAYLEFCDAVVLYYEALVCHEEALKLKKKGRSKTPPDVTLDDVFLHYAVGVGNGITRDEVEALYRKWAPFFVSHFPKELDFRWDETQFSKWIHGVYSEMKKGTTAIALAMSLQPTFNSPLNPLADNGDPQIDLRSERPRGRAAGKLRRSDSIRDVEMSGVSNPQVQQLAYRNGRPVVESPVPLPPQYRVAQNPTPVTLTDGPTKPIDVILDCLHEIGSTRKLAKLRSSTVHTQIYLMCRIRVYKGASDITAFYAKQLLAQLPPEWKVSPFHKYLLEVSKNPPVFEHLSPEEISSCCVRRVKKAVSQASNGTTPQPSFISDSNDRHPKRARTSGKAAGLRLISTSRKRPASEMESDYDEPTTGRGVAGIKSLRISHADSDDGDTDQPSDLESDVGTDDDDKTSFLVDPRVDSVSVVVTAERVPTMSPTGPNGTWVCDQEGCAHIVRGADEQAGQELVQAHFRHHEAQAERVSLAKQESRGQMPINHLLTKLQASARRVRKRRLWLQMAKRHRPPSSATC